jgi:hypothetical protein
MSFITRNLKQTVTYWGPGAPDGYGGRVYDAPILMMGRWEDRQSFVFDKDGKQIISTARVYLTNDVVIGGFLFLGTDSSTDPTTVDGAREIQAFNKSPNLRATDFERKALL